MKHPIIEINNLSFSYQKDVKLAVLQNINIKIFENEFISVVGPSGCGKTTLLKLICGLLDHYQGDIKINGSDPLIARDNHEFGVVFQNPVLFDWRNVFNNVSLPFEIFNSKNKSSKKIDFKKSAMDMIKLVGLEEYCNVYPYQLSGGMQSRVAIARALCYRPKILLMDEPFGDLDEITRSKLNHELLNIWQKTKCTIIFITHNLTEAIMLSDKVVVLSERPAKIKAIIELDLERSKREENNEYKEMFHDLKHLLNIDE